MRGRAVIGRYGHLHRLLEIVVCESLLLRFSDPLEVFLSILSARSIPIPCPPLRLLFSLCLQAEAERLGGPREPSATLVNPDRTNAMMRCFQPDTKRKHKPKTNDQETRGLSQGDRDLYLGRAVGVAAPSADSELGLILKCNPPRH